MSPEVSLAIQYGQPAPELPRWRLRRWVQRAVAAVAQARQVTPDTALPAFSAVELTLRLVDEAEGRQLNHAFRERDYATNVLTFEYGTDPDGTARGDVVLCLPVLHREAADQHKTVQAHAAHLTIHGVLHALGYDHIEADQAVAMEALEVQILHTMGIDNPYSPE
ncbi:MAG: rRNA maturation RNase YbeY [Candidimonas sp.]|nr:rRNA maturation RNase YbeY [Candidimonas sp.]